MSAWLKLAFSPSVVRRAVTTAIVVGIILLAINYGDAILHHSLSQAQALRMLLTFFVPYCVSTYSSVSTILNTQSGPLPSK